MSKTLLGIKAGNAGEFDLRAT